MNDKSQPTTRDYTDQEKKAIIAADKSRNTPRCPLDQTSMEVNVQRSLGLNSNVVIRCPRCSNSVQYTRLHG
jgi:hypothetical protein